MPQPEAEAIMMQHVRRDWLASATLHFQPDIMRRLGVILSHGCIHSRDAFHVRGKPCVPMSLRLSPQLCMSAEIWSTHLAT